MMENQAFIDSLMREIVQPGVDQLTNRRFFSELRQGKLSKKRLQGFALQHYLFNHVINMVRFKLAKFEGVYDAYA